MPSPARSPELVKMADLARLSGVPAPTIKHYLREGLLPQPSVKTSRNMAWYDAALVPRIQAIKELQRTRFLPLKVIRDVLEGGEVPGGADPNEEAAAAIGRALSNLAPEGRRSRADLVASGVREAELDLFVQLGIISPQHEGNVERYGGDDLALLETLGEARRAGLRPDMLPPTILGPYVEAIRELVKLELQMFRGGVLPRAGGDVARLTETATALSERLVVLLRRKMLVPMLRQLIEEETAKSAPAKRERRPPKGNAPDSSRRVKRQRGKK
jgi:DNA-binding transcriptional MerR regulator